MRRVLILVEGQTEERFVKDMLQPHLWAKQVHVEPKILTTKKVKQGRDFKGGVTKFSQFERDLRRLLGDTDAALVTTMLDYYGLPSDFPGRRQVMGTTPHDRARELEEALEGYFEDAGPRFRAFLMLHEFEALLFVSPPDLAEAMNAPASLSDLEEIRDDFPTPEDINEGEDTHPSRRISKVFPQYQKRLHGPLVTGRVGLDALREECPHFAQWVSLLESVG